MRWRGNVSKDGICWLAEVPILNAMTQGHTRPEALSMATDLLETLVNHPGCTVEVHPGAQWSVLSRSGCASRTEVTPCMCAL